ncbi:MAG: type II toxin-antitoxin system HicB family antitoxin [Candidatus Cloacimonetes bacterium]|nr:type II toxin-antitoxin system HicB family antitoxin [Candidatus Cloacimonadota bacterium]
MNAKRNCDNACSSTIKSALYRYMFLSANATIFLSNSSKTSCVNPPSPDSTYRIAASHKIKDIPAYVLTSVIECDVTQDEDGSYLADCPSLNIYSSGKTPNSALKNLKHNIADLYQELNNGSVYSDDWLRIKQQLNSILKPL